MSAHDATRWSELPTEAPHPASHDLDTLASEEIVALLLEEDRRGLERALTHRREIARAAELTAAALETGHRVHFVGAGTSGRLGILEAAECPPTFGTEAAQITAAIAGGDAAVFRAAEGAEDSAAGGAATADGLSQDDLLIAISASSVTPFARGALRRARERGAATVLVTCAAADELADCADLVVALDTGAEVLTGSTRLKAGSATKAALNAITTAAMVRLGKVYRNLMVDLRPGSAKLRDRAVRIVGAATGLAPAAARSVLDAAGGDVKVALVMSLCAIDVDEATRRLAEAGGRIRAAVGEVEPTERT